MSKCASCGAPVLWLNHRDTGKPAPIDVSPSENGNVILFGVAEGPTDDPVWTGYAVLAGEQLEQYRANQTPLRTSHLATCRDAVKFRSPKSTEPIQMEIT